MMSSSPSPPSSGVVGCLSRMGVMVFLTFGIMRIFYHAFDRQRGTHNDIKLTSLFGGVKQSSPAPLFMGDGIAKVQPPMVPNNNLRTSMQQLSSTTGSSNGISTNSSAQQQQQQQTYLERKKKKRLEKEQNPLTLGLNPSRYNDQENILQRVAMTWEQFINLPMQPPRHTLSIPHSILKRLKVCSEKGNIGNPLDIEARAQQSLFAVNSSSLARKGCNNIWNDQFLNTWKTRKVKGLCEDNANSKISCFDSMGKSRYCIFENAMMNFRKVRKRKQQDSFVRSWERGFLSADCGDMAPDDIGYLPLYKPDIEGREDAICDYIFNETVLVYSHENIRNYHYMISDYLNVFSMLWLSGANKHMNDVTFLNIDGLNNRKAKYNGDQINQFFKPYNVSFRRIIKAHDLAESGSKVCFKKLIMQPRPELQFQWDGIDDHHCPVTYTSSLYQRFNLQIRHQMQLLPPPHQQLTAEEDNMSSGDTINILLISRSLRPGQLVSATAGGGGNGGDGGASGGSGNSNLDYVIARLFRNEQEMITSLETYLKKKESEFVPSTQSSTHSRNPTSTIKMNLKVTDLVSLPYDEQIKLVSESSIVMGMFGAGIASSIHMSIGGMKYCCGVLEIFPPLTSAAVSTLNVNKFMSKGYSMMSRKLGYYYERLDIPTADLTSGNQSSNSITTSSGAIELGTAVPIQPLLNTLDKLIDNIVQSEGSCLLPEVVQLPYI